MLWIHQISQQNCTFTSSQYDHLWIARDIQWLFWNNKGLLHVKGVLSTWVPLPVALQTWWMCKTQMLMNNLSFSCPCCICMLMFPQQSSSAVIFHHSQRVWVHCLTYMYIKHSWIPDCKKPYGDKMKSQTFKHFVCSASSLPKPHDLELTLGLLTSEPHPSVDQPKRHSDRIHDHLPPGPLFALSLQQVQPPVQLHDLKYCTLRR